MDANYTFAIDRQLGLVRITMSGLFGLDDVAGFVEQRREAHNALGCAPNAHLTLNDVRGMKIQQQEIVRAFQDMLADRAYRSRRLAFVAGRTLTRSQLMRALASRHARCFEDMAEAEAWLLAADSDAQPARHAA